MAKEIESLLVTNQGQLIDQSSCRREKFHFNSGTLAKSFRLVSDQKTFMLNNAFGAHKMEGERLTNPNIRLC